MAGTIALRPATADDEPFLFALFASAPEYCYLPAQFKDHLLRMQYEAQRSAYRAQFPGSGYEIVLSDGLAVGKIWLDCGQGDWYLVDIAISPDIRSQGVGTLLLRGLQAKARNHLKPIRSTVARFNTGSLRFHQRLGFTVVGEDELHLQMLWTPGA